MFTLFLYFYLEVSCIFLVSGEAELRGDWFVQLK